jgi:Asp-tRNA(Asn)/Glu-tRNA(Gln) amidotransferase A subunit family amidase
VLEAISGHEGEYVKALGNKRLDGIRLLFPTNFTKWEEDKKIVVGQREAMQKACSTLQELGAECIEAPLSDTFMALNRNSEVEDITMQIEFVCNIAKHLSSAYEQRVVAQKPGE